MERPRLITRIALTLLSLFSGWVLAGAIYLAYSIASVGRIVDGVAVGGWTLLFGLAGWMLLGLPIVIAVEPDKNMFHRWWGAGIGSLLGFAVFSIGTAPWFLHERAQFGLFAAFSIVMGGGTWVTYGWLLRRVGRSSCSTANVLKSND